MTITAAKLQIWVGSDTKEAEAGLKSVNQQLDGFGKRAQEVGKKLTTWVTLPLLGAGVASTKLAADFDRNMSVLRVQSGATADEMERLKVLAEELGADLTLPGTSAADAAEAMLELSKAGLSIEDVMNGVKGTLQLSAAGHLSNALAAEINANALNAFHLSGSEATKVADLLAAAANASSGEVTDMADALKMSAAVAYSAGISVGELVTMISEMSNAGIQGSDAGTSLKQMILSLQAPTDKAAGLMRNLGIAIYDANGSMLPMEQIIASFAGALGGLSEEQRNAALATIFGSDAVRAANIVLMAGTEAYDKMANAVNNEGAAAELAAAQNEGLAGMIDNIKSSAETAMLAAIEPFKDDIVELGRSVAEAVGSFASLDEETRKNLVTIGLLVAAAGPTITVIGTIVRGIGALIPLVQGAAIATQAFTAAWGAGLTVTTSMQIALGATVTAALPLVGVLAAIAGVTYLVVQRNKELKEAAEQASAGMDIQLRIIQNSSRGYEDYLTKTKAVLQNNHLLVREQNGLVRVMDGSSGVMQDVSDQYGVMNEAQYETYLRNVYLQASYEANTVATEDMTDATQDVTQALVEEQMAANNTSMALQAVENALDTAGWGSGATQKAIDELRVSMGETSAEALKLESDVNLVARAFGEAVINGDELAEYLARAQEGTLNLSLAERVSLDAASQHAEALRMNAEAADAAALAQSNLAQSLKDATDAQIAQALIGSLKEALDSGDLEMPDYLTAVSGIQETFGLADEKSRALAEGIGILTGALANGKIPAEEMGTALSTVIADAEDGVVDWEGLMAQYTTSTQTMGENLATGFSETKTEFLLLGEEAQSSTEDVVSAFTDEDWAGVGSQIGEGVAAGITASTPAISAAAAAAAAAALAAMQAKLDINSPSGVFEREVGYQIDAGVARGIDRNRDMVYSALPMPTFAPHTEQTASRTPDEAADLLTNFFARNNGGGSTSVKVYIGTEELDARIVRVVEEKI
jgi:TP901 family phage tail tape measure protein